jgi:curved DNA-binding protein CbpA
LTRRAPRPIYPKGKRIAHTDDYYRVLGVARDASTPDIRRAYRRLARQHHPDRNPKPDGPERFRTLAEAYAVLNDPARRARYDHTIRPPARRDPPRATPAARRGVLELSAREARLAATMPLTLATTNGMTIMLPAGLADGDQITIVVPEGRAVLTVRVNGARKT